MNALELGYLGKLRWVGLHSNNLGVLQEILTYFLLCFAVFFFFFGERESE